jgi:hypothetical protein
VHLEDLTFEDPIMVCIWKTWLSSAYSITSSARASRGLAPMGWQDYKATAPSGEETAKERVGDANRNRAGRSGLSANLDL